jgi:hypothetical protein
MPEPVGASRAAGDIAIQALLFVLIEMTANKFDDPNECRREIRKFAGQIADRSAVPVPPVSMAQDRVVRDEAKRLIEILTSGGGMPQTN